MCANMHCNNIGVNARECWWFLGYFAVLLRLRVSFEQKARRQFRRRSLSACARQEQRHISINNEEAERKNNNKLDFVRSNEDKRCFNEDGDTAMKGEKRKEEKKSVKLAN